MRNICYDLLGESSLSVVPWFYGSCPLLGESVIGGSTVIIISMCNCFVRPLFTIVSLWLCRIIIIYSND